MKEFHHRLTLHLLQNLAKLDDIFNDLCSVYVTCYSKIHNVPRFHIPASDRHLLINSFILSKKSLTHSKCTKLSSCSYIAANDMIWGGFFHGRWSLWKLAQ